jgi:hypothetical protein
MPDAGAGGTSGKSCGEGRGGPQVCFPLADALEERASFVLFRDLVLFEVAEPRADMFSFEAIALALRMGNGRWELTSERERLVRPLLALAVRSAPDLSLFGCGEPEGGKLFCALGTRGIGPSLLVAGLETDEAVAVLLVDCERARVSFETLPFLLLLSDPAFNCPGV